MRVIVVRVDHARLGRIGFRIVIVTIAREVRMGLADIPGVRKGPMKLLARLMGETALGLGDIAVIEAPGWREAARGLEGKAVQRTQVGTVESEDGDDDE